jgi:16S rRNA (uracil1498-N3)-methyltransferase
VRSSSDGAAADLAARRDAAAHVFVADLAAPELAPDDRHHLERVLRLRPGEVVSASDGAGGWRLCTFAAGGRLEPVGDVGFEPAPSPVVGVGFALTKGDKPEWAVQKLTEVGVDVIVPFVAARSVVKWDPDKAARNAERFERVAREAAMQSRRVWLPQVRPVVPFAEAVTQNAGRPAGSSGSIGSLALAEPGGESVSLAHSWVFVGPEGGWAPEELALGLPNCSLGSTILRAETATVAVGMLLCALRGGFVQNHDQ